MDDSTTIPYGYCHCGCGEKTQLQPFARKDRGLKQGEPSRYRLGHRSRLQIVDNPFAGRTLRTETGCIEWQGSRRRYGYGRVGWRGKNYATHRLAWTLAHGPIPEGMFVCHRCDNPACVNIEHLFLGTNRDNVLDMVAKGRGRNQWGQMAQRGGSHCVHGHQYAGPETYRLTKQGTRVCRECDRLRHARKAAS